MRVLITGVTGMAGSHLADYIIATQPGVEVYGLCRWRSRLENLTQLIDAGLVDLRSLEQGFSIETENLLELPPGKRLALVHCDITDAAAVRKVVRALMPDRVFHLAAQSYVPASWQAPAQTLETNIIGETNLLEAIVAARIQPQIHIAGSSEEYGLVYPNETPVRESNPLRPLSPYGVSKVAQELLAIQYWRSYGLRCVVTRAFNHEGPRRGDVFVSSAIAKQIAQIEKDRPEDAVIWIGDTTAQRDWTDVRDVVRGYWLALEQGEPGEVYNLGCGVGRTVQQMLDVLLSLSEAQVDVRQDPARLRPSDVQLLVADASKFRARTGWQPVIPFEQTMADLLDYWRARVAS